MSTSVPPRDDNASSTFSAMPGIALGDENALKEAFYGEHAQHLLLLQYETLVRDPAKALAAVYEFIGEPLFKHDFNNVQFDASEFDTRAGTPGLHAIGKTVAAQERATILPPDVFRRFENDAFWLNAPANTRGARVV